MKTHKGAAKRFRVGARGVLKAAHSKANHLKSARRSKMKRRLSRTATLFGRYARRYREFMGLA